MASYLIGPDDLVVLDTGCDRPVAFIRAAAVARLRATLEHLQARRFRLVRFGEIGQADLLGPSPAERKP